MISGASGPKMLHIVCWIKKEKKELAILLSATQQARKQSCDIAFEDLLVFLQSAHFLVTFCVIVSEPVC